LDCNELFFISGSLWAEQLPNRRKETYSQAASTAFAAAFLKLELSNLPGLWEYHGKVVLLLFWYLHEVFVNLLHCHLAELDYAFNLAIAPQVVFFVAREHGSVNAG
jgi:hypothetical protein